MRSGQRLVNLIQAQVRRQRVGRPDPARFTAGKGRAARLELPERAYAEGHRVDLLMRELFELAEEEGRRTGETVGQVISRLLGGGS